MAANALRYLTVYRKHKMNHISKWYVINLKKDVERWQDVEKVLLHDFKIEKNRIVRIDAVEMKPGWKGCTRSHLKAVRTARRDMRDAGEDTLVAILEDDLMCHQEPAVVRERVQKAYSLFDRTPDAVYLAMTPQRLDDALSQDVGLHRVRCSLGAAGTIYRCGMLDRMEHLMDESRHLERAHDFHTAHHQSSFRAYGFRPPVCKQRPGFSRIEGKHVDYGYLEVDGAMIT